MTHPNDLMDHLFPSSFYNFKQQNQKISNENLRNLWYNPLFDDIILDKKEVENYLRAIRDLLNDREIRDLIKDNLEIEIGSNSEFRVFLQEVNRSLISKILQMNLPDDQINSLKKLLRELFLKKFKLRSHNREKLLERILESSYPIEPFPKKQNFLVLAREWNSWYPSAFHVSGGCYILNINEEIILIDPGFNTLDILDKKNFDIRLIRHIFITHFHPDHFESLTSLLTRLTSKENQLKVYLNSTAFRQFQVYSKNFTEFIELKPNTSLKIECDSRTDNIDLVLEVVKSYHKEVGGNMNSIGLKFIISGNQFRYKIGFLSDTDGLREYIDVYHNAYKDCDILIPHLGAIHKEPVGNKHLYLTGLMDFLNKLSTDKIVFLGEFGLELGSNRDFFQGLSNFISDDLKYCLLMKNIFNLLFPLNDDEFGGNEQLILELYVQKFEIIIKKIDNFHYKKSLELILPFMLYNQEDRQKDREITEKERISSLKDIFMEFLANFDEESIRNIIWDFLKKLLFQKGSEDELWHNLNELVEELGISTLFSNFNTFTKKFFPYLSREFKNYLLENLLNSIKPMTKLHQNLEIDFFLKNIQIDVNTSSVPIAPKIHNFTGIASELKKFLQNSFEENKFGWKAFTLLFLIDLIIQLKNSRNNQKRVELLEGREFVSKYLDNIFSDHLIFPVHPSFKIIFSEGSILIGGKCKYNHYSEKTIQNINRKWNFLLEENKEKFIDIIPEEKCDVCEYEKYSTLPPPHEQYPEQVQQEMYGQELRRREKEKRRCECLILYTLTIEDIFNVFNNRNNEGLEYINSSKLICDQIKRIMDHTMPSEKQTILVLLHPKLIKYSQVEEYVSEKIENLPDEEIIDILNDIIDNNLPYNDNESHQDRKINLDMLDKDEIVPALLPRKRDNIDFKMVLKFIKFFKEKLAKRSNKLKEIRTLKVFKIFRYFFIQYFFPLIEKPNNYPDRFRELKGDGFNYIDAIRKLGYPFNYYSYYLRLRKLR